MIRHEPKMSEFICPLTKTCKQHCFHQLPHRYCSPPNIHCENPSRPIRARYENWTSRIGPPCVKPEIVSIESERELL